MPPWGRVRGGVPVHLLHHGHERETHTDLERVRVRNIEHRLFDLEENRTMIMGVPVAAVRL